MDGIAFVTDLNGWDQCKKPAATEWADHATEFLGLAYGDGEPLAMLRISGAAIDDWSALRRPTMFDALDHWWWICWKDDSHDSGHTLDLAALDSQPAILQKGGMEWVIDDQIIDSTNDKIVAVELGATRRSTNAGDHSKKWHAFCELLEIDSIQA